MLRNTSRLLQRLPSRWVFFGESIVDRSELHEELLPSEASSLIVDTLLYRITHYTKTCSLELNEPLYLVLLCFSPA